MVLIKRKGQFTIIALMMTFIMLLIYAAFLPAINEIIADVLPQVDSMTGIIISMIPLAIAMMILSTVLVYGRPEYARG